MTDPKPSQGRIKISVPETYRNDLDESVWDEIELYLFQGFFTCNALIQNQLFVFKTLNHHEVRILDFMRPFTKSPSDQRLYFRNSFIAQSIFMVNGNNVLIDREKNLTRLIKIISKFSGRELDVIFDNLSALNEKQSRVYPLTEPYAFEQKSRFKWMQTRHSPLNSVVNTGIAGTENLGLNHSQLMWTSLNNIYDRKDDYEMAWQNAKFIGSCSATKGIRSIDERDKSRAERERTEREELKMKVLKNYLNRTTDSARSMVEKVNLPDGRSAEVVGRFRAESAEELAEQLSRSLNGEKDAHDLAVEKHFRKSVDRQKEIEKERRLLLSAVQREKPLSEGSSTIPKSEAEERIKRLRELMINAPQTLTPNVEASNSDK